MFYRILKYSPRHKVTTVVQKCNTSTNLCILEAQSRICQFLCTQPFLFRQERIRHCIGTVCLLHTWGDLQNSRGFGRWPRHQAYRMLRLQTHQQKNTNYNTEACYKHPGCFPSLEIKSCWGSSHGFVKYDKGVLLVHLVRPTHPLV